MHGKIPSVAAVIRIIIVEETVIIFESDPEVTCPNSNFTYQIPFTSMGPGTCTQFLRSSYFAKLQLDVNILSSLWACLRCGPEDFVTSLGIVCPIEIPAPGRNGLAEYQFSFVYFFEASNLLGYRAKLSRITF